MTRLLPGSVSGRAKVSVALFLCTLSSSSRASEHEVDLELVLRGGGFVPTRGEGSLAPIGVSGGATVLLRLTEHFALGAMLDAARIGWSARGSADGVVIAGLGFPDPNGSMHSTLHAVAARWYVVVSPHWLPYVDASVGYLSAVDAPDHPDCGEGSGASGQLALGFDWWLSSWARVGGVAAVRPLRMGRGCSTIYYTGMPPSPPHGGLAVSGQVAFTTVWSSE